MYEKERHKWQQVRILNLHVAETRGNLMLEIQYYRVGYLFDKLSPLSLPDIEPRREFEVAREYKKWNKRN